MELILSQGLERQLSSAVPAHTRIFIALTTSFCLILSTSLLSLAGFVLLAAYLWQQSPVGMKEGLKRLLLIDGLIILTILPLPFSFVGDQVVNWGPLTMSEVGLLKAVEVFVKSTLSVTIMMSQFSGLPEIQLARALHYFKVPVRFILLLQFTVRYISVMQQELSKLKLTLRARGFGNGPMLHNWKSYGYLFGMLFVKALTRADSIWFAMKCRGYQGRFPVQKSAQSMPLLDKSATFVLSFSFILLLADVTNVLPGLRI
ncbi:energy-coupling factor transporter transmembrane component T family protein [Thaumasiovibrio sp. DFM-14]|uniref:energy-coupling factor transporter transmembrane component T family protein n=1 Tax=Thaumasiovibrio sp. DFM-14 TaxID=3384792 RepID=UPI0039A12568